jgi:uncharacterized protein
MLCPVCAEDMFVLEFDQVELDYCTRCGGVWLDSGELELLGVRAGALQKDLLCALETHTGEHEPAMGRRPCPVCRRAMAEVDSCGDTEIMVDRCARRHGLWFDEGELHAVVTAAGADTDNVLARFLAGLAGQRAKRQSSTTQEG